MSDTLEFVSPHAAGLAAETSAYIAGVADTLADAAPVIEALVLLQGVSDQAGVLVDAGPDADHGQNGLEPIEQADLRTVAEQLVAITRTSVGLLQGMVDKGHIEVSEDTFAITPSSSAPLELEAGDANSGKDATVPNDGGDKEVEKLDGFTRTRQVNFLVSVFGEDRRDEIEDISQAGMVIFGKLLGERYRSLEELTGIANARKEERAEHFEDYVGGMDLEEMAKKYGLTKTAFPQSMPKAVEMMKREVTDDEFNQMFDVVISYGRQKR